MTKKIVCLGEILLRLSPPGKQLLLQSPGFEAHVGGAEANVAVALSKLGHASAMVSALPDNPLGRVCADELRKHGVDTSAVQFRDGRMGLYFLTHGAGQRPAEVLYDRAQSAFATTPAASFDWNDLLADAQWLHVSGITPAISAAGAETALSAVQAARARRVKVSFDCNFRARLWGARTPDAPKLLRQLCEHADLIFGDDRDIAFMVGFDGADAAPTERRRLAAAAAFDAFKPLQWIPVRRVHNQALSLAGHCRSHRRWRRLRCRHIARADLRFRPAGHRQFRYGGGLPEAHDSRRFQPHRQRGCGIAVVGVADGCTEVELTYY
jgi:2-dehydro-3-deoxygluconokinase